MIPVLVDGNSLFARAYFAAVAKAPPEDVPVAAAELFFRSLLITINPQRRKLPMPVTHLLVCWDGVAKRDKQRAPKPAGFEELRAWVEATVPIILGPGTCVKSELEADDAIATAAWNLYPRADVLEIYIVSGDKDLQQLVNDKTRYYCLNEKSVLPCRHILGKWNVKHPSQISIALAILGDSADKINGVKGWGPKKVIKLFESFTAETPLVEIAETIAAQLPPDKVAGFMESLELTVLQTDLAGIPEPAAISVCDESTVVSCGLTGVWPEVVALSLD